jgi:hypothetical protein
MPRQMYGLGSFVKKAVKGVTKGIKSIAKSDLGKAALLACSRCLWIRWWKNSIFWKIITFFKQGGGFSFVIYFLI